MIPESLDRTFESLEIGEGSFLERILRSEDVDAFAKVSGDYSPLHVDQEYASTTPFKERVVHGMLLGSYVSALVGMQLPGTHALLVKESLEFKNPVHIGDTVTVKGTVMSKSEATRLVEISIDISVEDVIVAEGSVTVQVRA